MPAWTDGARAIGDYARAFHLHGVTPYFAHEALGRADRQVIDSS